MVFIFQIIRITFQISFRVIAAELRMMRKNRVDLMTQIAKTLQEKVLAFAKQHRGQSGLHVRPLVALASRCEHAHLSITLVERNVHTLLLVSVACIR